MHTIALHTVKRCDAARPRCYTGRVESSPFDALLVAAEHDPEAAEGLAQAYGALSLDQRRALIESVVADVGAAGRSPTAPLALMLAVEGDRELARSIANALVEAGARHRARHSAWSWGSDSDGGIAVARPLTNDELEVVALEWRGGELSSVRRETLIRRDALDAARAKLGVPDAAAVLGLDDAVDRLAECLWRSRVRRGSLPEDLRALAHLFAPY